ncbi:MAG: serine--tRNA ligase [Thermoprotei archaeon]
MLDIKLIRKDPEGVRKNILRRHKEVYTQNFDRLLAVDAQLRRKMSELELKRAEHNRLTRIIAQQIKRGSHQMSDAQDSAARVSSEIGLLEKEVEGLRVERDRLLKLVPNLLDDSTPDGTDESNNIVVRHVGDKPVFDFEPKSHVDLIAQLDLADIDRAAKIAGSRFYFLRGDLVLLDLAVLRFALDKLVEKGFIPVFPPEMMRREAYEGVTPLQDFEDTMYKVEGENLYLIATSEHPLVAMHMDEVFEPEELPLKYAGISVNFRKEAGAHGKDTKGIFRVHNFNKVEQVVFCRPEDSPKHLEELLGNAEEIFRALEVPYRIVEICSGDISPKNAKQYDIEAWMPAQQTYREVVSTSNCTSYQAVSLNIKYRLKHGSTEKEYVHTLNSTAVATPRALVAILENHQQRDGVVKIPKALVPYMNGKTEIAPKTKTT